MCVGCVTVCDYCSMWLFSSVVRYVDVVDRFHDFAACDSDSTEYIISIHHADPFTNFRQRYHSHINGQDACVPEIRDVHYAAEHLDFNLESEVCAAKCRQPGGKKR
jgi:hypothetical protein